MRQTACARLRPGRIADVPGPIRFTPSFAKTCLGRRVLVGFAMPVQLGCAAREGSGVPSQEARQDFGSSGAAASSIDPRWQYQWKYSTRLLALSNGKACCRSWRASCSVSRSCGQRKPFPKATSCIAMSACLPFHENTAGYSVGAHSSHQDMNLRCACASNGDAPSRMSLRSSHTNHIARVMKDGRKGTASETGSTGD